MAKTVCWPALLGLLLIITLEDVHGMTSRSYNSGRLSKKLVYVGGLFSNISSVFASIESAIKDINYSPSVLGHHQLQFIFAETAECDVSRGFQTYLDFVDTLPRKLLIVNGLCSEIIRTIDHQSRTPRGNARSFQLSYSNMDPAFESSFQSSLFRLLPPETAFSTPRTQLLNEISSSKQERIGLIYQNIPTYAAAHEEQVNQLLQQNFLRLESEGFEESVTDFNLRALMRRLKERNVSIMLGNFGPSWARKILCLAYQEGMFGESYKWVLAGNYESNWWRNGEDAACSIDEIEKVLDGMLRIDIFPFLGNSLDKNVDDHRSFHHGVRTSKFDGYVYDSMWTMAYALHNVSYYYAKMTRSHPPSQSDDFITNNTISFQNPVWQAALQNSLADVNFLGVTGPVAFDNKHGRFGYSLLLKQFQSTALSGYDEVNVGEFDSVKNKLNLVKFPHRMIQKRSQVLASKAKLELEIPQIKKSVENEEFADEALRNSGIVTSGCIFILPQNYLIVASALVLFNFHPRLNSEHTKVTVVN